MIRFGPKTPKPHALVLSIPVLLALIGFSILIMVWSYHSAVQTLEKELQEGFENRMTIAEIILEHQMELVDMALVDILEEKALLDAVARKNSRESRRLLLDAIDNTASLYLDVGFISLPDDPVWTDASSSLYDLSRDLPETAGISMSRNGIIYRSPSRDRSLTLGLKARPMVHPVTGKILGRLIGGFVLDNHLELMEKIQAKTRSGLVVFLSGNRPVSASVPLDDPLVKFVETFHETFDHDDHTSARDLIFCAQPLQLYGSPTPIRMAVAISDAPYVKLKQAYATKTWSMFILALGASVLFAWFIRRLTAPSLIRLLAYAKTVTSGNLDESYRPGTLVELNQVGRAMETMVDSLARANQELVFLRNYLSNIIDSMPSVLVGMDTSGRVTQWNQGAVDATGLSQDDALGRPLEKVFPFLSEKATAIDRAIQSGEPQALHKTPLREGKEIRYHDITIYPLTANGAEGAVIRMDDVTDAVLLEERMVQSEKMLSVGGLAAGMAHEINNPLAGMIQTADTLKKRLTMDLPANTDAAARLGTDMETIRRFMADRKIPRLLDTIRTSGMRAAEIVTNMLSFARKGDAGLLPNDLTSVMDDTLALSETDYDLKKKYDFRQVKIIKNYHRDMPRVPCDPAKIKQVFFNILTNGAQAMCARKAEQDDDYAPEFFITIRPDHGEGIAVIEIEDNGPGMDEPTRKRVFEPFFTTKPEGIGTGLGLSVSYFIVRENHNGQMRVTSSPGTGTTFQIRLPLVQEGPSGQTHRNQGDPNGIQNRSENRR